MEKIYEYTLKLIRYVLTGDVPELPESINFDELYDFGAKHGIENMLYIALSDLSISVPERVMIKFEEAHEMQIMIEATQAIELDDIGEKFKEAGINYMPLKGSVVKYLYPMPDYRKSGDIDILIHPEDEKKVHKIMIDNQYEVDDMDEFELHVGYRKPPMILIEIHDRLLEKSNRAYSTFKNVWSGTEVNVKNGTEYEMSKELFYVFSVAHFCKHIKNGGAGIKFITDIFLMNKHWKDKMENDKLNSLIEKSELSEFNEWINKICCHWFEGKNIEDKNVLMLENFILTSGSFGTDEQARNLKKSSMSINGKERVKYKLSKTFRGIFVKYEAMRSDYPILIKYRFLLPAMWVVRLFKILSNRDLTKEKLKRAYHIEQEKANELKDIWKAVC